MWKCPRNSRSIPILGKKCEGLIFLKLIILKKSQLKWKNRGGFAVCDGYTAKNFWPGVGSAIFCLGWGLENFPYKSKFSIFSLRSKKSHRAWSKSTWVSLLFTVGQKYALVGSGQSLVCLPYSHKNYLGIHDIIPQ